MNLEHFEILGDIINISYEGKEKKDAIKYICIEWSDNLYDTLDETYQYLLDNKPEDVEYFIKDLECIIKINMYLKINEQLIAHERGRYKNGQAQQ